MQLEGKVAIVTGAARGIGFALAERFVAEGAAGVTVCDLDPADCHAAANRLGERALDVAADVSVGDDDGLGTFGREPLAQRPTDAVGSAGDDRDLACQRHRRVA